MNWGAPELPDKTVIVGLAVVKVNVASWNCVLFPVTGSTVNDPPNSTFLLKNSRMSETDRDHLFVKEEQIDDRIGAERSQGQHESGHCAGRDPWVLFELWPLRPALSSADVRRNSQLFAGA